GAGDGNRTTSEAWETCNLTHQALDWRQFRDLRNASMENYGKWNSAEAGLVTPLSRHPEPLAPLGSGRKRHRHGLPREATKGAPLINFDEASQAPKRSGAEVAIR